MNKIGLLFPHQLFENNPLVKTCNTLYLVEEFLFFKQYPFHKQKIAFHRASMKFYEAYLKTQNIQVEYIDAYQELADIRSLIPHLASLGITSFEYLNPTDCWLKQRIEKACKSSGVTAVEHPSPLFLCTSEEIKLFFSDKKRMFQTDFYRYQRQTRAILLDENQKPMGGKWSFDTENRLKFPKGKNAPKVEFPAGGDYYEEAINYTKDHFAEHYGELNQDFLYPANHIASKRWLQDFLETRFSSFGIYEDAIVSDEKFLHHSLLTPMLNVGLLSVDYVINETLAHCDKQAIPLNSVEGFIRQIIGWREFIRAVYELQGSKERTKNYWGFSRKIPASFWSGTTGIEPIDSTIKKVLETGYCHHIERLMILGNFMLLCEFDPDEVYRWFMELFIDAYDWVMVPNVYGMSQFADGGLMATKPYISGSNYITKMSDYKKGPWQSVWDGLFWRFMHTHRQFFQQNPRLSMLLNLFDKMPEAKQRQHLENAERFMHQLDHDQIS